MAKTRQDLAKRAMQLLGLLEAQEDVAAEDFALIDGVYATKYAEWYLREKAWWPIDEIPDMAFHYVADQIAELISTDYGRPAPDVKDDGGETVSIGERGRRGILRLIARERTGLPTQAMYF